MKRGRPSRTATSRTGEEDEDVAGQVLLVDPDRRLHRRAHVVRHRLLRVVDLQWNTAVSCRTKGRNVMLRGL